jgi:hypothetical protein
MEVHADSGWNASKQCGDRCDGPATRRMRAAGLAAAPGWGGVAAAEVGRGLCDDAGFLI